MDLLVQLANGLMKGLSFTQDLPEQQDNLKCPMLDIQVWIQDTIEEDPATPKGYRGGIYIRHTYFEKDVTSPLVFNARGAYPWRAKLIILAEEAKR